MTRLAEHIDGVSLIDHHVHGCRLAPVDRRRFEDSLNEANIEPLADFDSAFDTQLGFAVRAHCAPLLGLPRHVDADSYWRARLERSEADLARLFLSSARVSDWLVDTGFATGVADLAELDDLSVGRVHEIVRLESVAEQAVRAPGDYASVFAEILDERAATAVATKSILAYRGGFAGDLSEPPAAEVATAAQRWRDSGEARLTDRVLLRFGLYQALRLGKPIQFHVGFGDRDCDLRTTNPLYLLDFLRCSGDVPIVLLHCYPYEREAGYLARRSTTSISTVGWPSTFSARGRRRSSAGWWRWRRFAKFSIRPTDSVPRSCTTSERVCGAMESAMCSRVSSTPANGVSPTLCASWT